MKFKKLCKSVAAVLLGATVCLSAFAFVGCKDDEKGPVNPPVIDINDPANATINVNLSKNEIAAGSTEKIQATATIENFATKTVVWSVSGAGANYVDINANTGEIKLKTGLFPQTDVEATITATCTATNQISASATLKIKAQVLNGEVGELKTEMFTALGNPSITVTGEVADIYRTIPSSSADQEDIYEYTVKMSDGAWYGEWNKKGLTSKDITNYRKSENVVSGTDRHTFDQVYINKYNQVAQKAVTDYHSKVALWEDQHLWNHLAQLGNDIVNQWKYDEANKVYVYQSNSSEEDLYLRTYLAISMTPMLVGSDTLDRIFITVEDGKITKMEATTVITYYGSEKEGSSEGATAMSYTSFTANFSDVGTTVVPTPVAYEVADDDEDAKLLERAVNKLKTAESYTFAAKEETISAPSGDDSEYTEYSASTYRTSASDNTSATGTEGLVGKVTNDAVLLARTGKYSYSMDDKLYWTKYSGYKKTGDDAYDYFEYSSSDGALVGKQKYSGNLMERMPDFDFSTALFECVGDTRINIGGTIKRFPTYVLREPAITRDIALEVSAHSYAANAEGATYGQFEIIVNDETEQIYSISYPYSLISGTYLGIIETKFSNIGSTTLPEDTFAGYVERVIPTQWSQMDISYYHPDHTTQSPYGEIDAGTLLTNMFGPEASKMPAPDVFVKVFGDSMSVLSFDWEEEDNTASGGTKNYYDYFSFNMSIEECDENYVITEEIHNKTIAKLTEELTKIGFTKSVADSQKVVHKDFTTYYTVYTNGNIMIKIENTSGRFFYIDILPSEIWWHFKAD